jgi:trehalose 6-phosphate synthase
LVLSRFAGAAEELTSAVLTNPWDIEGTVSDLDRALRMPLEERRQRHQASFETVSQRTAIDWAQDFMQALSRPEGEVVETDWERSSGLWVRPSAKAFTLR